MLSQNHTLIYENSELKCFKDIKYLVIGEIYSNWPNDVLETNVYKIRESCW